MKKDYSPPVFRYLDFLYPQEPALAQRTSGEDGLRRSEPPNRTLPPRPTTTLAFRGGLVRTFGGLATFLVVIFLCSGIYILEDLFANPIAAQAAALISGAFVIALGTILLFYLLRPGTAPKKIRHKQHGREALEPQYVQELSLSDGREETRGDSVYQRVYVDHSRVKP
jgi:hypothetical protein